MTERGTSGRKMSTENNATHMPYCHKLSPLQPTINGSELEYRQIELSELGI